MQINNFTQRKQFRNSKLLTLLTNRSRAKSVPNIKDDWPGLFNPNFATNIKYKSTINNSQTLKRSNSLVNSIPILVPITPVTSIGRLQLKPDLSNKITFKRQLSKQSGRFSTSKGSRNKVSVIRIQQNQENLTKSTIFRNSTINNKVNQISDQQNYFTARHINANIKQNITNIVNQRTFLNQPNFNNTQKTFRLKDKPKQRQISGNNFKVDFFTFGYIEKVINNPQLWAKYVHKVRKNQDQPTLLRQLNLVQQK